MRVGMITNLSYLWQIAKKMHLVDGNTKVLSAMRGLQDSLELSKEEKRLMDEFSNSGELYSEEKVNIYKFRS